MKKILTPEQIDALLPQTQCGLCDYQGCMPYAEAIALNNESIDRCLPGGVKTLLNLAKSTDQNAASYLQEMQKKAKPPMLAVIRENECIGCTKCIQACPVDAIIGAAKQMHTVISAECTGCELCVAPCPVDCIDMMILPERSDIEQKAQADLARQRYQSRNIRLKKNNDKKEKKFKEIKLQQRKTEILAAVARVRAKRR